MTTEEDRPCGFVLSGGAAYAAYEIGVMRALLTRASPVAARWPCDPSVLAGSSGGAVNAALFASSGLDDPLAALDYVEWAWLARIADQPRGCGGNVLRVRANPLSFFDPNCLAPGSGFYATFANDVTFLANQCLVRGEQFLRSSWGLGQRLLEAFDLGTLVASGPLRQVLDDVIDVPTVRNSPIQVRIAATNWRTGELRVFTNADMTDENGKRVVMASGAIPGVVPSVEIDGEPYVDGGVVMNTPLRPAIQAGATVLHVIYMDPDVVNVPLPRLRNTISTLNRSLVINFGVNVSRDIRLAQDINQRLRHRDANPNRHIVSGAPRTKRYRQLTIHRYHPAEELGRPFRFLDFSREHIRSLIDRGYKDARNHSCFDQRCVHADADAFWHADETAAWVRRDA